MGLGQEDCKSLGYKRELFPAENACSKAYSKKTVSRIGTWKKTYDARTENEGYLKGLS